MEIIERQLKEKLKSKILPGKVLMLLGPRRVGKTFLINQILQEINEPFLAWSGEDVELWKLLETRSVAHYRNLLGNYKILFIDEAQKINEIGAVLKLMVDNIEGLKVVTTGSSSFDLNLKLGEPLTGRKWTYHLFPVSEGEFATREDFLTQQVNIQERMVFGGYPELINLPNRADKTAYLVNLIQDYLLKDILELEGIKITHKIMDLLRLIAFQVGHEVSYSEIGQQLGMDKATVERYLNLLSEIFILFNVRGYSRNLRKEITKNSKWYFFDNGIRNAIISNLQPLPLRADHGLLWENYIISERIKFQRYSGMAANNFFWRTYDQQEIDWVEERDGSLFGYEMKWREQKPKAPTAWSKAYPEATYQVVHPMNWREFIGV